MFYSKPWRNPKWRTENIPPWEEKKFFYPEINYSIFRLAGFDVFFFFALEIIPLIFPPSLFLFFFAFVFFLCQHQHFCSILIVLREGSVFIFWKIIFFCCKFVLASSRRLRVFIELSVHSKEIPTAYRLYSFCIFLCLCNYIETWAGKPSLV